MSINRRDFFRNSIGLAAGASMLDFEKMILPGKQISCNQYSWITFYAREGHDWGADKRKSLTDFVASGLKSYEPAFNNASEVVELLPLLREFKLDMPSVYVNTSLHKSDEAQNSIKTVLEIADALKPARTSIIVTNPNPIAWGSDKLKTDEELIEQAKNLNKLGAELKKKGITLAYHTHDVELKAAAREFHHMLLNTDPANVSLCLDVHWVYRGSGNSQVALFDIVKLYGKRIVELHIRQSKNGIWQETFSEGDINYPRLVSVLSDMKVRPHLVLEQCLEKTSPNTVNGVAAHKQDLVYASQVFKNWLK